jgi:hypothetical protein
MSPSSVAEVSISTVSALLNDPPFELTRAIRLFLFSPDRSYGRRERVAPRRARRGRDALRLRPRRRRTHVAAEVLHEIDPLLVTD